MGGAAARIERSKEEVMVGLIEKGMAFSIWGTSQDCQHHSFLCLNTSLDKGQTKGKQTGLENATLRRHIGKLGLSGNQFYMNSRVGEHE